jgi:sulfonate transport system substrate-binding protein
MTRRRTIAVLAAVFLLAGCAHPAAAGGGKEITLRIGDQKAGSRALLTAAGLLDGTSYRIQWSEFTSGPPLLEALNAGAVDLGAVGDTPPIFAAAAGSRIVLVGATYASPKGSAILVPKDSPITDLAGLKGRKVAVAKGSSANAHLLNALTKVHLTFHDITPVYLQPADALAALSNGSIDAWAIWDPYTALAQERTGARVLVDGTGGLLSGLGFQVAAPAALTDPAKAAAIGDYLNRLARARQWTHDHPDAWASAWAKVAGIPVSVATVSVRRADQHAVPIDDALIRSEQATADAFADAGLIPRRLDISTIVDRRFNDAVKV